MMDEPEPEHSGEQRARDHGHAADHQGEHDDEAAEHRELRLVDRLEYCARNAPANPAIAGRQHEHGDLGLEHVDADGAAAASLSRSAMRRRPNGPRRSATMPTPAMPNTAVTSNRNVRVSSK